MKAFKKGCILGLSFLILLTTLTMQPNSVSASGSNLAFDKDATASSVYPGKTTTPDKAVDGITTGDSRWSSKRATGGSASDEGAKEQWLTVDLGKVYNISQINILWEAAYATKYKLQGALDADGTFFDITSGSGKSNDWVKHTGLQSEARYVRLYCEEAANAKWGYSVYELEVYESTPMASAKDVIASIENTNPTLSTDGSHLILPNVPEGFDITLYGTDNAQVVSKDNIVYQPLVDMPVKVMYKVTKKDNPKDYATSSIDASITIPGKHQVEETDHAKPNVLPGLREWKGAEGNYQLTKNSRIVYTNDEQKDAAMLLQSYFKDMLEQEIEVVQGVGVAGDIVLNSAYNVEELGNEGYYMSIDDMVTISSPTMQGLRYGSASIAQILYQSENFIAPKGVTRDYPQYEVRAGMIDVGRMYIPLEYLKEMTIYMSFYKLNEAQIHINDYWGQSGYSAFRLESEVYPSINAKDGYYTKEDYKQYQKDMKAYGIDVITEIDTPYHAEAFKDIPGVVMWPGQPGRLDIRTEKAFDANAAILENLIDEYLDGDDPVIQSNNFHIGTDEYDKGSGEQMRKWTNHFAEYVNAKGYQSRAWASLGKNGFNGTTPVTKDIVMNLWAPYWADVHETYAAGYDVINTYGGWLYIVPAGNAGYPDRYDTKKLYEKFEVNDFKSGRNPSGEAIMPVAHPQTKGAEFALWNDMTSFKTGFSWFDINDRIKDAVSLVAEKTWYGEDENYQTYEQFRNRIDALQHKVPNANPSRFVESDTDLIADYTFDENGKDATTNGYDATLHNATAVNGEINFDGNGYISLPMQSIGYPYSVLMNLTFNEIGENATLFAGSDGTFYLNKLGKLSYARDQYEFTFNYTPKAGENLSLALTCDNKNLSLYVNGKYIGTGKLTNATIGGKTQQSSTFVLPVEQVFANTKGILRDMSVYNRVLSAEEIYEKLGIQRDNLALHKMVSVSGLEVSDGRFTGEMAVDGIVSKESRVSFAKDKDEQWLQVDLGEVKTLSEFVINFESSVGKYEIQVSETGENFETVYTKNEATVMGATPAIESAMIDPVEARYVKYVQKERWKNTNTNWYSGSIYEFEVYAPIVTVPKPSKDALIAAGPNSSGSVSASRVIGASTLDNVNVEFDMYTSLDPAETNTAVGVGSSDSNYTAYGQVPIIVRMFTDGCFGAYNGAKGYVQSKVSYTQNEKYHIRITVNLKNSTYSAYATGPDGKEVCFAQDYSYRAAKPNDIGKIYLFNNERPQGSYWLENITLKDIVVADKTALQAAVNEAMALVEEAYTSTSYANVMQEVKDAQRVLNDASVTTAEVNAKTALVKAAMNNLVNVEALRTAIATAQALDVADYTPDSYAVLSKAIIDAQGIFVDGTAEDVTQAVNAIAVAVQQLVPVTMQEDIQKEMLRAAINKALQIREHELDHVANVVVDQFNTALDQAVAVLKNTASTPEEMKTAWFALANAMHYLDFKADKTQLNQLIVEADVIYADLDAYKEEGKKAFIDALTYAKEVSASETALNGESIAKAYDQLADAISKLQRQDGISTTVLEYFIQQAEMAMKDAAYYAEDAAWTHFMAMYQAAKNAITAETQAAIDAAASALADAYEDIRLIADEERLGALASFIAKMDALDAAQFNAQDYARMQEAKAFAQKLYANKRFTLEEFATFEQQQNQAMEIIKRVEEEGDVNTTTPPTTPEDKDEIKEVETPKDSVNQVTRPAGTTKTGDTTNMGIMIGAMVIALGAIAFVIIRKRKTSKKENA